MIECVKRFYRKNEFTYYLCFPLRKLYNVFFFYVIPDKIAIERKFFKAHGYKLNWSNLRTYSEKMQWLKLYDRLPWYSNCVDKFKVREYITQRLGTDKYLIPLFFETQDWREIKPENIPDEPFVIKCNHDNASYTIVRDKNEVDWKKLRCYYRRRINGRSFFWSNREWPYKNVKPRIMVEKYLCSQSGKYKLQEYKFHCFHGEIKVIAFYEVGIDNISRYRHLNADFEKLDENYSFGSNDEVIKTIEKPIIADEMKAIVLKIASDFKYCIRVDVYHVDNKLFIGELTFYDGAGFDVIRTFEWNLQLGSYLCLPTDKN